MRRRSWRTPSYSGGGDSEIASRGSLCPKRIPSPAAVTDALEKREAGESAYANASKFLRPIAPVGQSESEKGLSRGVRGERRIGRHLVKWLERESSQRSERLVDHGEPRVVGGSIDDDPVELETHPPLAGAVGGEREGLRGS